MKITAVQTKYLKGLSTRVVGRVVIAAVTSTNLVTVVTSLYKEHNLSLLTMKATDERKSGRGFVIYYIFGIPKSNYTIALELVLKKESFPSIVGSIHKASLYEQEIQTFFGLEPVGHPFTNPLILHENWPANVFPLRKDFPWNKQVPISQGKPFVFQQVIGEGIYEIPVGPVHAGIIEPGHFRFSVIGEKILSLQPQLGFVHKGSEKLFEVLPIDKQIKLSEHISGDMSFTHSLAFCQALEDLGQTEVPLYAKYIRVICSELERIANHINDIGFILNDTAFAFGGSNGQRLKEEVMQLNERLTGSRFFRGMNTVGGVTKAIPEELLQMAVEKLESISRDFSACVDIAKDSETVINRLKTTGTISKEIAQDHGVVGVAARAVGLEKDVRVQYPYAGYEKLQTKMALQTTGDVYARFQVRIDEVYESISLITRAYEHLKKEKQVLQAEVKPFVKDAIAVGMTEGWRGEIVYVVKTDQEGKISRVGVRDPSYLNWPAVPYAVEGNIVPDFPLINKSFNLSYSGFDR